MVSASIDDAASIEEKTAVILVCHVFEMLTKIQLAIIEFSC